MVDDWSALSVSHTQHNMPLKCIAELIRLHTPIYRARRDDGLSGVWCVDIAKTPHTREYHKSSTAPNRAIRIRKP